jgi:hypothetical protein
MPLALEGDNMADVLTMVVMALWVTYLAGVTLYIYPSMEVRHGLKPKYALIWPIDMYYGLSERSGES